MCLKFIFKKTFTSKLFFVIAESFKNLFNGAFNFFLLSLDIKRNFSMPSTYANGFAHSHFVLVGAIRM